MLPIQGKGMSTIQEERFLAPSVEGGFSNAFLTTRPWTARMGAAAEAVCGQCNATAGGCGCRGLDSAARARGVGAPSSGHAETRSRAAASVAPFLDVETGLQTLDLPDNTLDVLGLAGSGIPRIAFQTGGPSTISELFDVARADAAFEERRNIFETEPGGYLPQIEGRYVNRVLGNIEVPVAVNQEEDIFGQPETAVSSLRADQANGFGPNIVNDFTYAPPGTPGSRGSPFIKDVFYVTLGSNCDAPYARRLNQTTGNFKAESAGLALYINGMVGRTIYLVRRPEPYYFVMPHPRTYACNFPGNVCNFDPCKFGAYFTTDPIGGNACSVVNGGVHPPIFPLTRLIRPNGNVYSVVVTNEWPQFLWLQNEAAPLSGCAVIVLGRYP